MQREEVNAKDYVRDLWAARSGHRLLLRFYLRGPVNPYSIYSALLGKASWLGAARYPVHRLASFVKADPTQSDFFRGSCIECGLLIPVDPLDQPYDAERCPRCRDAAEGALLEEVRV
jgi:hypothetical protein